MQKSLAAHTIFRLLIVHQFRRTVRSLSRPGERLVAIMVAILGLYMAFTLVVLGAYFPKFVLQFGVETGPLDLVNAQAIPVLFGLFGMRFLFQKTPRMQLQPYLHLPVPKGHLISFFVGATTLSLHNIFPLLFTVPLAIWHIAPNYGPGPAFAWVFGGYAMLPVVDRCARASLIFYGEVPDIGKTADSTLIGRKAQNASGVLIVHSAQGRVTWLYRMHCTSCEGPMGCSSLVPGRV